MILVDDSLIGCPIGGMVMGVYDTHSYSSLFDIVPVGMFQGWHWDNRSYCKDAAEKVLRMVEKMNVPKTEKILVCQGWVNNDAAQLLHYKGHWVERRKIYGDLQDMIEERAYHYLISIGYPDYKDPEVFSDYTGSFWDMIKWVEAGEYYEKAKTGWDFWKRRQEK